jgi:hypothetical protein
MMFGVMTISSLAKFVLTIAQHQREQDHRAQRRGCHDFAELRLEAAERALLVSITPKMIRMSVPPA